MQPAKLEAGNTTYDSKGQAKGIRRSREWAALFNAWLGLPDLAQFGFARPMEGVLARAGLQKYRVKLDIHSLHTTATVPGGMLRDFKSIETAAWTQTAVPAASQLVPCSRHFSHGGIRALRIWIRHQALCLEYQGLR